MTEQWQELKETITELRDNDGTCTQQEVCKFLANLMEVLEKQMQEPKQVELEGDGYSDGEIVYDYGKCPKCGWDFEEGDKDWEEPYCCHCGQKLKWFDDESESEE